MIALLRCARSPGEAADSRRAAGRSLDAWRSSGSDSVTVVLEGDPRGTGAEWELLVREPEALVPPGPLVEAAAAAASGETRLVPEGVYAGGIGPPAPYVAVWQFEEARRLRSRAWQGVRDAPAGLLAPAEFRKRGSEDGPARLVSGWLVHSFAGRRSWNRSELLPLVPSGTRNALEVGCAEAAFGELLEGRGVRVTGIEPDGAAAALARDRISGVIAAPLEEAAEELEGRAFDLVVLGDVLEHLSDPAGALRCVAGFLRPGGTLLFSLPNASHAAVLAGMLQGRFDHALEGIVADDHRTYAGRRGWEQLLSSGGFEVDRLEALPLPNPSLDRWLAVLGSGGAEESALEAVQWIGTARAGRPGRTLDLGSWKSSAPTALDSDDPVGEVRQRLLAEREVRFRVPNAVASRNVLALLDGGAGLGEARSSLARGFTAHGLRARFQGTGIGVDVAPAGTGPLPERMRRLVERARTEGLPVAEDDLSAASLDVTFRKEID